MATPVFAGEIQLLRWSETSTGGATVTFQLADVRELERFKDLTLAKKGMAGQRIAAVMMQYEDDEEPEAPAEVKQKPGMLCIMACTFCADPKFISWSVGATATESDAKDFILSTCDISSRKELDTNKAAAARFHAHIRLPYLEWSAQP